MNAATSCPECGAPLRRVPAAELVDPAVHPKPPGTALLCAAGCGMDYEDTRW